MKREYRIEKLIHKTKKSPLRRQFLTKPSSWAKLLCVLVLVVLISWLNLRPKGQVSSSNNQDTDNGKVAGMNIQPEPDAPKPKTKLEEMIGKTDDLKVVLAAGKKFMDEKKFSAAQLAFERATELAPDYRDVWYLLAVSYISEYNQNPVLKPADYSLSKLDKAIFALTRAQVIDPQSEQVKELLETAKQAQKSVVSD